METSEELQRIFKAHEHGLKQAFAAAASLNNEKEKLEGGKTTRDNKQKKGKPSKRGAQTRGQKGSKAAGSQPQKQDTIDLDEWIGFLGRYEYGLNVSVQRIIVWPHLTFLAS
jgi:hypothetical protein